MVSLKLHIESESTAKFLTTDSAADLLLFADGHACPLLKEECMGVYVNNIKEVKASPRWRALRQSSDLLGDLRSYSQEFARRRQQFEDADYQDGTDPSTMSISMIRTKLETLNLDFDGTK